MINIGKILKGRSIYLFALLISAVTLLLLAPLAAINVDEVLHNNHAKKVIEWYSSRGADISALDTPETNLKYYGQSVDNLVALINKVFNIDSEYSTRKYTGAMLFFMLLLFSGNLSYRLSNSWLAASITVLSLIFMPRLSGQAFGNLKDIPFATGYIASILLLCKSIDEMPNLKWKTAIALSIAIAFTISIRAGGMVLFFYTAIIWLISLKTGNRLNILKIGSVFFIGYFLGLLFWPYALKNIFLHPYESLKVMEYYQISIRQIFEGKMVWSTQLPYYYLPKWLYISTPLFALFGFLIYSFFWLHRLVVRNFSKIFLKESLVLFALIFPVIYVVLISSNLYSGVRQMIFILPPLAILAVIGYFKLSHFLKLKGYFLLSKILIIFSGAMLFWPIKHQIQTFPVDYVFFNSISGGNKKAWGNFEYDYYYHSAKQPAEELISKIGQKNVTVAMNCDIFEYFAKSPNIQTQYVRYLERSSAEWDYGIFVLNYIPPVMLKSGAWKPAGIIKTYYHKNNPAAILIKRVSNTDYNGLYELKEGNFQVAEELLRDALNIDPGNIWLHANLANLYLNTNNFDSFKIQVEQGFEIHPLYEPLLLLKAEKLLLNSDYENAKATLETLINYNPFYPRAIQLYSKIEQDKEINF